MNPKEKAFYQVDHFTELNYSDFIWENIFILTMKPIETSFQKIKNYHLTISPKAKLFSYKDHYGNNKHFFNLLLKHKSLKIHSTFKVIVEKAFPAKREESKNSPHEIKKQASDIKSFESWDWLKESDFTKNCEELKSFLKQEKIEKQEDPFKSLQVLNSKLFHSFKYSPNTTQAHSLISEILSSKKGVCQDYTHVMIAIARSWGIACRYVSGYLYYDKDDDFKSISDQSHAWCECYLPSKGWVGFDPTNNVIAGDRHIKLALGRDYKDIAPHRAFFKGSQTKNMKVKVSIKAVKPKKFKKEW